MEPRILILFLISIQGIFLSLFLFTHDRGDRLANRWLGGFIGSFSLFLFGLGLEQAFYRQAPHLVALGYPLVFLIGPSFYLYTRTLTLHAGDEPVGWNAWIHLVPFGIALLVMVPFFLSSPEVKIEKFETFYLEGEAGPLAVTWLLECLHVIAYSVAAFAVIRSTRNRNLAPEDTKAASVLTWIYRLSFGNLLVWTTYSMAFGYYLLSGSFHPHGLLNIMFILAASLFIYLMGYLGWRRPELFSYKHEEETTGENGKYERSSLSDSRKRELAQELRRLMERDQLYLNPELRLTDLADRLEVSPNYISQVINEELGQHFYEFVNTYRVREAQRRLADPKYNHLSVLGIAEESGFNAKSTFNKVFREFTGTTPSRYRNDHPKTG